MAEDTAVMEASKESASNIGTEFDNRGHKLDFRVDGGKRLRLFRPIESDSNKAIEETEFEKLEDQFVGLKHLKENSDLAGLSNTEIMLLQYGWAKYADMTVGQMRQSLGDPARITTAVKNIRVRSELICTKITFLIDSLMIFVEEKHSIEYKKLLQLIDLLKRSLTATDNDRVNGSVNEAELCVLLGPRDEMLNVLAVAQLKADRMEKFLSSLREGRSELVRCRKFATLVGEFLFKLNAQLESSKSADSDRTVNITI